MKIVNRETFLTLPAGTVFAKYTPCSFGDVQMKADTCGADFVCNSLIPMFEGWSDSDSFLRVCDAMEAGESSPPFDYDSYGRDGFFDQDQLFAVFERRDLEALISQLQACLADGYPTAD